MASRWSRLALLVLLGIPAVPATATGASAEQPADLAEMSLEELMDVAVTSVSKRSEPISGAAAAVFVLTDEDLRRSGATSIPEALRLVPGLEVARIDSNKWAITSRGFNGRFANKLLVLIDGRSVYTPLFSGVFWDVQDTLLEDVERIEVIRGPGATLWGANAVNGVINIITRPAGDTQGGLLIAGGGSEERAFAGLRYGGALGAVSGATAYRVYGKFLERGSGERLSGGAGADDWSVGRGGFRIDSMLSGGAGLSFQGGLYDGNIGESFTFQSLTSPIPQTFDDEMKVSGGHLLGRWQRTFSDTAELSLQLYYDRTERSALLVEEDRDTLDAELQHGFAPTARQRVVWGLGYRRTEDDIRGSESLAIDPARRTDGLVSAFLQDEIMLRPDALWLTLGSKIEDNDYSGLEVQPNVRAVWIPRRHHTLWAAVSRAVRTPSRAENDLRLDSLFLGPGELFPGAPPAVVTSFGDRDFGSEELVAWETGYRLGLAPGLLLDLAAFYNDYDRLRGSRVGEPFLETAPFPHLVVPLVLSNDLEGETWGAELVADWRATQRWRWTAAYSFLDIQVRDRRTGVEGGPLTGEGESPQHQVSFRSAIDLPRGVELDLTARWVDELPGLGIDSYTSLDLRLGWRPSPALELSVAGQNLLDDSRVEFAPEIIPTHPTAIERGVYGKLTWRF
ncbi:MAG TPA: TonB-dependent receptor [Thermoanaerobaculia bacterium]|nr:TonB-dependent receptor [Thermoanaerobaculia bacterium]